MRDLYNKCNVYNYRYIELWLFILNRKHFYLKRKIIEINQLNLFNYNSLSYKKYIKNKVYLMYNSLEFNNSIFIIVAY
jgi:hypothetical protein